MHKSCYKISTWFCLLYIVACISIAGSTVNFCILLAQLDVACLLRGEIEGMMTIVIRGDAFQPDSVQKAFESI